MKNIIAACVMAALAVVLVHSASQEPPQTPAPGQDRQTPTPAEPAAPAGRGQGRGTGVFPAQQRPPADPALVERGKAIYSVTCSGCHGVDARGGQLGGPNLLRSPVVLGDQAGELILPIVRGARASKGMPALNVPDEDVKAVAAFLHSLLASGGRQGAPPPSDAPPPNIVVGDAAAGKTYFAARCSACHSVTGDLQGIATRVPDPKTLQNLWVSGGMAAGGRGGRRGGAPPSDTSAPKVMITLGPGQTLQGQLLHIDDFIITFVQPNGLVRSVRREGDRPAVVVEDPLKAHRDLLAVYTEKDIHDVTAYLVSVK